MKAAVTASKGNKADQTTSAGSLTVINNAPYVSKARSIKLAKRKARPLLMTSNSILRQKKLPSKKKNLRIITLTKISITISLTRKMRPPDTLLELYSPLSLISLRSFQAIDADVVTSLFYPKTNFIVTSITLA